MALGATEALTSIFSSYPSTIYPKLHSFNSSSSSSSLRFHISLSAPSLKTLTLHNPPFLSSFQLISKKSGFQLHSTVETVTVEEQVGKPPNPETRRKLFVLNLPWSYSVADIKKMFTECGTVEDVEIIKHKNGKSRGFAFLTMASAEEAQAAIEKYDSCELVGRIIKVEFAKGFKKPTRKVPVGSAPGKTRCNLYVSNLAWKVRSNHLREFFASDFNPVSVKVVFDSPSGKSAGYGFVYFATKEEAESAISVLDGKELLGRPIRLKLNKNNTESDAASESKEVSNKNNTESDAASESKEESSKQSQES